MVPAGKAGALRRDHDAADGHVPPAGVARCAEARENDVGDVGVPTRRGFSRRAPQRAPPHIRPHAKPLPHPPVLVRMPRHGRPSAARGLRTLRAGRASTAGGPEAHRRSSTQAQGPTPDEGTCGGAKTPRRRRPRPSQDRPRRGDEEEPALRATSGITYLDRARSGRRRGLRGGEAREALDARRARTRGSGSSSP